MVCVSSMGNVFNLALHTHTKLMELSTDSDQCPLHPVVSWCTITCLFCLVDHLLCRQSHSLWDWKLAVPWVLLTQTP